MRIIKWLFFAYLALVVIIVGGIAVSFSASPPRDPKRLCNFYSACVNYSAIFDGHVVGINDWFDYTKSCKTPEGVDYNRPVEGLQAPDKYTIVMKLLAPYPQMEHWMATTTMPPLCKAS